VMHGMEAPKRWVEVVGAVPYEGDEIEDENRQNDPRLFSPT